MIVQCPSCSKRYRVNDDNIPPSGGKIRCPECSHAFVVYPESDSQSGPAGQDAPGEKTSVAQRPDMQKMLDSMQGEDPTGGQQEDEGAKTEVMSGSELPDFGGMFGEGGGAPTDPTTEMQNPLSDSGPQQGGAQQGGAQQGGAQQGGAQQGMGQQGGGAGPNDPTIDEDQLRTEQLDSDIVDQSLGHVRDGDSGGEAQSQDDVAKTEVVPPQDFDDFEVPGQNQQQSPSNQQQSPSNQQRASASDAPTPPPGGTGQSADQGGGPANTGSLSSGGASSGAQSGPDTGSSTGNFGSTPAPQGDRSDTGPAAGGAASPSQSGGGQAQSGGGGFGTGPAGGSAQGGGVGGGTGPQSGPAQGGPAGGGPAQPAGSSGGGSAAGGGPDPNHDGPWKLQTNFGLTYEFADNDSLRDWLDSRDDLDGYELSADGDNFFPLDEFSQVSGSASPTASGANAQISSTGQHEVPSNPGQAGAGAPNRTSSGAGSGAGMGASPSSPGAGAPSAPGQQPSPSSSGRSSSVPPPGGSDDGGHSPFRTASASAVGAEKPPPQQQGAQQQGQQGHKERIDPNEKFEPPSESSTLLNVVLWGVFVLLAAAAALLALELFDVIDILDDPEQPEVPVVEEGGSGGEEGGSEAEVEQLLAEASEHREANRLTDALESLRAAAELQPERAELYEQQAEIHEELGQTDEAEQARQRAREAAGGDDEGAEDAEGEPAISDLLEEARGHLDADQPADALEVLEQAVSADPEHVRVYDLKAEVHEQLDETDQAEQARTRARELREQAAEEQ